MRSTNVARLVADCFKFRKKIGLDVALEALQEAWRAKRQYGQIWRYATLCRVANVMRPYMEACRESIQCGDQTADHLLDAGCPQSRSFARPLLRRVANDHPRLRREGQPHSRKPDAPGLSG